MCVCVCVCLCVCECVCAFEHMCHCVCMCLCVQESLVLFVILSTLNNRSRWINRVMVGRSLPPKALWLRPCIVCACTYGG